MIRVYFRQAWIMLKQNRLFSYHVSDWELPIALSGNGSVCHLLCEGQTGLSGIRPGPLVLIIENDRNRRIRVQMNVSIPESLIS